MARTSDANQSIEVNLGVLKMVSGVVLQGRKETDEWITKFIMEYKVDVDGVWMVVKDANQQEVKVSLFLFQIPQACCTM